LINNASAVTSYFVLNSRHNIYIFLGFKVVYIVAAGNGSTNGNENDSMWVGREWEQESHSHTPILCTTI